ncbi:SH3 domain-containing protein [Azospirillum sp. SYSU D00513]|uniref:SH3 domain-containing protein n=1 Tax=Azospirillum sp. SYSU D00513 TaxID=2812561 RepID=UPI001A957DD9|nr:SH3 domain-containing protein [Azospirillum sp. SYSU D00513]
MDRSAGGFRGSFGAAGAALLLLLTAAAAAQEAAGPDSGAPESFTPRPPPTALLPRLTPELPDPRAASAPRLPAAPPPVVAPPLSAPLPGEVPADGTPPAVTAPPLPAPVAVAPPQPAAATPAPPAPAERAAEVPVPAPKPELPTPAKAAPPAAAEAKPAAGGGRTVWAEQDVYVRDAPNRNGRIVDGLSRGDRIERMETLPNGWARVARNGRKGYTHGNYLSDSPPPRAGGAAGTGETGSSPWAATPSEARAEDGCALPDDLPANARDPVPAGTRVRVVSDAYLRAGPGCNARVLDVLEKGETVTVLGNRGNWYQVGRDGRVLGFVGGALLVPVRGR